MTETVVAPDVEALTIGYLNALVTPPVSSNIPNPRPDSLVRVSASGGEGFHGKVVFRAVLTLEAWAAGRPAAFALAAQCCAHLEAAPGFYAECSAPAFFPDPDTGSPRYVATVQLATRGSVL